MNLLRRTIRLAGLVGVVVLQYAAIAQNQGVAVRGTVIDDSTRVAIENANVFISQTTLGSSTKSDGRFEIRGVPPGSYELVVSRLGYENRIVRMIIDTASFETPVVALRPKMILVNEVAITGSTPEEWKKQLEKFQKLFLGESENAGKTRILNPEVLDFFTGENSEFSASARAPLEIENLALGYHILFVMTHFSIEQTALSTVYVVNNEPFLTYGGGFKFRQLEPDSPDQLNEWRNNRLKAYKGSMRHFLVSLFRHELARDGFQIALRQKRPTAFDPVTEEDILSYAPSPSTKILHFETELLVKYVGHPISASSQLVNTVITGLHSSRLRLNYPSVVLRENGSIRDWFPTKTYGFWAQSRIADALPLDYTPEVDISPPKQ